MPKANTKLNSYKISHTIELIAALIGSIIFALASVGMQAFTFLNHSTVQADVSVPECQVLPQLPISNENNHSGISDEIQAIIQAIKDIPNLSEAPISISIAEESQPTPTSIYTYRFSPGALF